jgi:hypothetical protein
MVVKPEECIAPTEEEQKKFLLFCNKIDKQLKKNYTKAGQRVDIRYSEEDCPDRVVSMVVEAYQNVGWRISLANDAYYDSRDGCYCGGPYMSFTA